MSSPFGHIDLRVTSMEQALPFYEALLPELGFGRRHHGTWEAFATDDPLPSTSYLAIVEDTGHVPNANRIAFWVSDRAAVDRLAEIVRGAGAGELSGPKEMPYGPDYYAVFFTDPCGNALEIYHRLNG